ncbi:MAG TPA: hypothetical protein PKI32_10160, partial [Opitutales bacterium]|nr:hypothetical protein [Opitutales bacterium]
ERIVRSDLCLRSGKVPELIFSKGSDASGSRPFATAGKKPVLLLRAHFTFSQDFRTLNLMVEVEGRAASPDSKVFYRNRILASTNSRLGPVIERMDRKLTIEEQAEFRNAFTTVCMEMVKLLAYDLAHSPAEEEQGAFGRIGSGLIIRMDEARIWARGSDGSLTSSERAIPQFQPASAPTAPRP